MRIALVSIVVIFLYAVASAAQLATPTPYFIEDGKGVAGYDSADRELAETALTAWARASGGHLKFIRAAKASDALLRVQWISAGEGQFGETQRVDVNGKPGAVVHVSPGVSGLGEPLATMCARDRLLRDSIVYLTCVHEIGHAVGMQHTRNFADIMYSFTYGGDIVEYFSRYRRQIQSRADIAKISGLSPGDIAVLKSLF